MFSGWSVMGEKELGSVFYHSSWRGFLELIQNGQRTFQTINSTDSFCPLLT